MEEYHVYKVVVLLALLPQHAKERGKSKLPPKLQGVALDYGNPLGKRMWVIKQTLQRLHHDLRWSWFGNL